MSNMKIGNKQVPYWVWIVILLLIGALVSIVLSNTYLPTSRSEPPIVEAQIKPVYCVEDSGVPCNYPPHGVYHAWSAGKLGPKQITVPASFRNALRAAVARRPLAFRQKVHAMSWFDKSTWVTSCVVSWAMRQYNTNNYEHCLTPYQVTAVNFQFKNLMITCGGHAIVGTGIGKGIDALTGKSSEATMIVGIGAAAECISTGTWDYVQQHQNWAATTRWLRGYVTVKPGSGPITASGGRSW